MLTLLRSIGHRNETSLFGEDSQALINTFVERATFVLIALIGAVLLTQRPIPTLESPNDTGRYVYSYQKQCAGQSGPFGEEDVSWQAFRALTGPLCVYDDERAFMFFLSLAIPLIFLSFGRWENSYLIWALAGTFNFFSFELATNALRQATGLFVLVASIFMLLRGRWLAPLFAVVAGAALHVSVAAYSPFVVGMLLGNVVSRLRPLARGMVLAIFVLIVVVLASVFGVVLKTFMDIRQAWYQEGSSLAFLGFVLLPSIYIYALRCITTGGRASNWEHFFFAYSMLLSATVLLMFPAILYRLALTNSFLQVYLAGVQANSSPRQGVWILVGLAFHLLGFFLLSDYARDVIGF